MTTRRSEEGPHRGTGGRKARTEYNLEKPPLQTGDTTPEVSLRTRAAMGGDFWTVPRRVAGIVALIVMVIFLVAGSRIIQLMSRFFERAYSTD